MTKVDTTQFEDRKKNCKTKHEKKEDNNNGKTKERKEEEEVKNHQLAASSRNWPRKFPPVCVFFLSDRVILMALLLAAALQKNAPQHFHRIS